MVDACRSLVLIIWNGKKKGQQFWSVYNIKQELGVAKEACVRARIRSIRKHRGWMYSLYSLIHIFF